MKKTYLILIFLLLIPLCSRAQYYLLQNRVWAMGRYSGMAFTPASSTPYVTSSQMQDMNNEGCAAICDDLGNLLFYSNGARVWDANGNFMTHGSDVNGFNGLAATATQGTLIVPRSMDNRSQFYLFTLIQSNNSLIKCKLYCDLIDMTLNGGHGDLDTTFAFAGIPLADSLSEKMIAIPGCNNNIWVLTHRTMSPVFEAYEVTPAGINLTPVVSVVPGPSGYNEYFFGALKVSPQWNKIARCNMAGLILYDFDVSTGVVYNPNVLNASGTGNYSAAFSPDGSKLYSKPAGLWDTVYQYNLNAPNIALSKTPIGRTKSGWADFKLGFDGKIYMASGKGMNTSGSMYLARVNNPDSLGAACNFQDSMSSLYFINPGQPTAALGIGLPNEVVLPVSIAINTSEIALDTVICNFPAGGLNLHAAAGYTFHAWSTGDTSATVTAHQNGTYWVRYGASHCINRTDTFRIKGSIPPISIVRNNNILSTTAIYNIYQWYKEGIAINGAMSQNCAISGNGWYSAKVTGALGCTDSAAYQVTGGGTSIDDLHALKNSISIYPNPASNQVTISAPVPAHIVLYNMEGRRLLIEDKQPTLNIRHIADGMYFIHINDFNNNTLKVEKLVIRHKE